MRKMWKATGSMALYNTMIGSQEVLQDMIEDNEKRLESTNRLDVAFDAIGHIWNDQEALQSLEDELVREETYCEQRGIMEDFWAEFAKLPHYRAL